MTVGDLIVDEIQQTINDVRHRQVQIWNHVVIGHDRHTPERLQHLLDCVEELRERLMAAKV